MSASEVAETEGLSFHSILELDAYSSDPPDIDPPTAPPTAPSQVPQWINSRLLSPEDAAQVTPEQRQGPHISICIRVYGFRDETSHIPLPTESILDWLNSSREKLEGFDPETMSDYGDSTTTETNHNLNKTHFVALIDSPLSPQIIRLADDDFRLGAINVTSSTIAYQHHHPALPLEAPYALVPTGTEQPDATWSLMNIPWSHAVVAGPGADPDPPASWWLLNLEEVQGQSAMLMSRARRYNMKCNGDWQCQLDWDVEEIGRYMHMLEVTCPCESPMLAGKCTQCRIRGYLPVGETPW